MKKLLALLLVLCMVATMFVACADDEAETTAAPDSEGTTAPSESESDVVPSGEAATYTFNTYATALATNWNPHTWEMNADQTVLSYLSMGFVSLSIDDSVNGVYQWVYDMATSIEDVTAENQADLDKYGVTLPEGSTSADITEGYVYEIKLTPEACWEDGTPINADTYIYSMKQLLAPEMKNYRANLYYAGESAVAGGANYYYAGSTAWVDTAGAYAVADLVKGEDGTYTTPDGYPVSIALDSALEWLGGEALSTYVDAYGDAYFGVDAYNSLRELADENGNVVLTDDSLALIIGVITAVADWGETEAEAPNYFVYGKEYPVCDYDSTVGCYKVDDYTIRYVCQTAIEKNYFLTSCTDTWLVYEDVYEAGKETTGDLVSTDYGTTVETTMSYGPYRLESLQTDKQMVFVQNENWWGWEENDNGELVSYTNYLVDGETVQQYQTTKIVIDVMDDATAKQAFLKGELTEWTPTTDDLTTYSTSEQLYKVDETYTMSFFFNTGLEALQEMDNSKGNTNSVVLSNINFRKAFSLAIDREEWVTATSGYKPAYATMNGLYFYDVYNDPTSSYRNSDEAMQAICNLYGVEYGEGTPYATLEEAYKSINGYNLTEAQALMKTACEELVAAGLYTEGEEIYIRIGYKAGALDSADQQQVELMNKYLNAAIEGSGFGKITLEPIGNLANRYDDTANGEFAIGYGAWGGAAFYPFRNFQVYCDPEQYSLHEAGCWDPTTETLTLVVDGEEVTKTWQDWSGALIGIGDYANSDFATKLSITAQMEEAWLKLYYRLPLASSTACFMMAYKVSYYTEEYNIMYDFGGMRLMSYNYSDAEWAEYVDSVDGVLAYE